MSDIIFEKKDGIATVTFNRPAVKNAISNAMCARMIEIMADLRDDPSVRVVLFRGEGPDFTAGADLKDLDSDMPADPNLRRNQMADRIRDISHAIFLTMDEIKAPIVASVRGHAVGAGAQIMLGADLVVASETAKLSLPMVKLAHVTDHGESYFLPRKVGLGRAMQIMLLGDTVKADAAERLGIVNVLTADADLEAETDRLVARLAASPREAVRQAKALLKGSLHRTFAEQFEAERQACSACAAHPDFPEALNAFLERRKPVFA